MDEEEIDIVVHKHPICAMCNRFMKLVENNVLVRIQSSHYYADIYQCPSCDARIFARFGGLIPPDSPIVLQGEVDAVIDLD